MATTKLWSRFEQKVVSSYFILTLFSAFPFSTLFTLVKTSQLVTTECESNTACEIFSPGSYCSQDKRICSCDINFRPSKNGLHCLKADINIGQPCTEDQQCVGFAGYQTSICLPGSRICACNDGYVPNQNFTTCLRIVAKLGEDCEEHYQCQVGKPGPLSECVKEDDLPRSVCRCQSSAVDAPPPNSDYCFRKSPSKQACQVGTQCYQMQEICVEQVCTGGWSV